MSQSSRRSHRVAVVGGGVTGLAAAHRLTELDPKLQVTLFEASDRLGGVLQTELRDGYCIELGPDSMITQQPWGLDLCRRIGFEPELLSTNAVHRQTYVVRNGRLVRLPEGLAVMAPSRMWPIVPSPVLSVAGKLRLGMECFLPRRRQDHDESLADFARRRLGREAYERLVQPLASGIYMGDPERLSMQAAFPRFYEMEAEHGSLIRATRRGRKRETGQRDATGPRYSLFVAPRQGMSSLVDALAHRLPEDAVRLNSRVTRLSRRGDGGWTLSVSAQPGDSATVDHDFDGVIVSTPAGTAGELLAATDARLGERLQSIPHTGCAIVILAFQRSQVEHPLDGFGFVVPLVEKRQVLACTFSSVKYAERAPADHALLRVFLGGACRPEVMPMSDDELRQIVARELDELLGISGQPLLVRVVRWAGVMPQYEIGHLERVAEIEAAAARLPGLELAGNAFRGVGIPHCIHSGEQAAERIIASFRGQTA